MLRARDVSVRASVSTPTLEADSMDSMDESMDENDDVAPKPVSAKASHIASLTNEAELDALIDLLPPRVRGALESHPRKLQLLEVVLDLGRLPIARFADGDEVLGTGDVLDYDDIERAMDTVGEVGGDNRAGINRTLHRISVIRNRKGGVVGLTARVGRAIEGSADLVRDLLLSGVSVLLLGRPGVGKTTAIREISRILSGEFGRRVVVVDTSNEIGGDGDIPHPGIGNSRRMQVPVPDRQHDVLIEAVQNHTPQCVIVDEIGTDLEAKAARTISQRGVQMIATAHGHTLENLLKNPLLNDLVGGVVSVTLGDDEARTQAGAKVGVGTGRSAHVRRRGGDGGHRALEGPPGRGGGGGYPAGRVRPSRRVEDLGRGDRAGSGAALPGRRRDVPGGVELLRPVRRRRARRGRCRLRRERGPDPRRERPVFLGRRERSGLLVSPGCAQFRGEVEA